MITNGVKSTGKLGIFVFSTVDLSHQGTYLAASSTGIDSQLDIKIALSRWTGSPFSVSPNGYALFADPANHGSTLVNLRQCSKATNVFNSDVYSLAAGQWTLTSGNTEESFGFIVGRDGMLYNFFQNSLQYRPMTVLTAGDANCYQQIEAETSTAIVPGTPLEMQGRGPAAGYRTAASLSMSVETGFQYSQIWQAEFRTTGLDDVAMTSYAVNGDGTLYLATNSPGQNDAVLRAIKYTASGTQASDEWGMLQNSAGDFCGGCTVTQIEHVGLSDDGKIVLALTTDKLFLLSARSGNIVGYWQYGLVSDKRARSVMMINDYIFLFGRGSIRVARFNQTCGGTRACVTNMWTIGDELIFADTVKSAGASQLNDPGRYRFAIRPNLTAPLPSCASNVADAFESLSNKVMMVVSVLKSVSEKEFIYGVSYTGSVLWQKEFSPTAIRQKYGNTAGNPANLEDLGVIYAHQPTFTSDGTHVIFTLWTDQLISLESDTGNQVFAFNTLNTIGQGGQGNIITLNPRLYVGPMPTLQKDGSEVVLLQFERAVDINTQDGRVQVATHFAAFKASDGSLIHQVEVASSTTTITRSDIPTILGNNPISVFPATGMFVLGDMFRQLRAFVASRNDQDQPEIVSVWSNRVTMSARNAFTVLPNGDLFVTIDGSSQLGFMRRSCLDGLVLKDNQCIGALFVNNSNPFPKNDTIMAAAEQTLIQEDGGSLNKAGPYQVSYSANSLLPETFTFDVNWVDEALERPDYGVERTPNRQGRFPVSRDAVVFQCFQFTSDEFGEDRWYIKATDVAEGALVWQSILGRSQKCAPPVLSANETIVYVAIGTDGPIGTNTELAIMNAGYARTGVALHQVKTTINAGTTALIQSLAVAGRLAITCHWSIDAAEVTEFETYARGVATMRSYATDAGLAMGWVFTYAVDPLVDNTVLISRDYIVVFVESVSGTVVGSLNHQVVAIDGSVSTPKRLWTFKPDGVVSGQTASVVVTDIAKSIDAVIVVSSKPSVDIVSLSTGTSLATIDQTNFQLTRSATVGQVYLAPNEEVEWLFVPRYGTDTSQLVAYDLNGQLQWEFEVAGAELDFFNTRQFDVQRFVLSVPPVTVTTNCVLFGDTNGLIHCVNPVTGIKRWSTDFETRGSVSMMVRPPVAGITTAGSTRADNSAEAERSASIPNLSPSSQEYVSQIQARPTGFLTFKTSNTDGSGTGYTYIGCGKGSTGSFCERCIAGYFRKSSQCLVCPDLAGYYLGGGVVLFILMVVVLGKMSDTQSADRQVVYDKAKEQLNKSGSAQNVTAAASQVWVVSAVRSLVHPFTQLVHFFQTISIFTTLDIPWNFNIGFGWFMRFFSVFNLSLELAGPECSVGDAWNFRVTVIIGVLFPIMVFSLFGLFWLVQYLRKVICKKEPRWIMDDTTSFVLRANVHLFIFTFVSVATKTLAVFDCTLQPDGSRTLDADPSVTCYESEWNSDLAPWAVVGIFVVCGSMYMLYYINRRVEDIAKRLREANGDYTILTHLDTRFLAQFAAFTEQYKPGLATWEVFVMSRKLLLVGLTLMLSNLPTHAAATLLTIIFYLIPITLYVRPYRTNGQNRLESYFMLVQVLIMLYAILLTAANSFATSPPVDGLLTALLVMALLFTVAVQYLTYRDKKKFINEVRSQTKDLGEGVSKKEHEQQIHLRAQALYLVRDQTKVAVGDVGPRPTFFKAGAGQTTRVMKFFWAGWVAGIISIIWSFVAGAVTPSDEQDKNGAGGKIAAGLIVHLLVGPFGGFSVYCLMVSTVWMRRQVRQVTGAPMKGNVYARSLAVLLFLAAAVVLFFVTPLMYTKPSELADVRTSQEYKDWLQRLLMFYALYFFLFLITILFELGAIQAQARRAWTDVELHKEREMHAANKEENQRRLESRVIAFEQGNIEMSSQRRPSASLDNAVRVAESAHLRQDFARPAFIEQKRNS
eukprot:TRINITY_DN52486_c0_g1_i1.p1 TRINITY_DN52486_c0_g1~~TRINITY_DN52486_c0_g1_i1.p1  ORF type:complete len:1938 (-),score=919.16 TRINITY_DN52486_c0_g1_i1:139-5952(-)